MRNLDTDLTEKQLGAIMDGLDANKDGSIDFEEFLSLMSARSTVDDEDELREAFKTFDRDGNGTINIEELRTMMQKLKVPLTEEELGLMMKEADADGNGVIDFHGASSIPYLAQTYRADYVLFLAQNFVV